MADLPAPLVDVVPLLTWFDLREGNEVSLQAIINLTQAGVSQLPASIATFNVVYCNAPGLLTVQLPRLAGLITGQRWTIKDISGFAGANTITVLSPDGLLIDGGASFLLNLNYGSVSLDYDGTGFALIA